MDEELKNIALIISELSGAIDTLSNYSYQKLRGVNLPSMIIKAKTKIEVALDGFHDLEETQA